jgi:hypothetical protein
LRATASASSAEYFYAIDSPGLFTDIGVWLAVSSTYNIVAVDLEPPFTPQQMMMGMGQ